jgi:uncharacterized protein
MLMIGQARLRCACFVLCAVLPASLCCVAQRGGAPVGNLQMYVGQYRESAEPDTIYSISRAGDALFLEAPRLTRTLLVPVGAHELSAARLGARFTMLLDANGRVTGWHRVQDTTSGDAVKISDTPVPNNFRSYTRSETMIPMRDGVRLHAVILRPEGAAGSLPILLERTPYGVDASSSDTVNEKTPELAQSGYIFVFEDIRGRYGSEGTFVMMRPVVHVPGERHDPAKSAGGSSGIDESTDAYDTVDWLVKNLPENNGRVGVMGISYPGFLAAMAGVDPHAAVKAVSPQAPMTDVWRGDDFFHNGAFRQSYGYDYVMGMESGKTDAFGKMKEDAYDYFLKAGDFANAAKKGKIDELPTARAFVEHPAYDAFWQGMAVTPWLTRVTVPTFLVGGWWDEEDMWGTQAEYAAMAAHDPEHTVQMMLGPWLHGQWAQRTMRHLDALDFGQATTERFRAEEAAFFAEHLKSGAAGARYAAVESFQTGSNTWRGYSAWPPNQAKTRDMYLEANAALSFERPKVTNQEQSASYISDPTQPVPYRHRPIQETYAPGSHWYAWLAEDQRSMTQRKDVAAWEMPALDHDLTVTGDVKADIFAATTGSDADWVVKLIDVYPDDAGEGMGGYQLMVAEEIFRGRYRESFTQPHPIIPGAVEEYAWSLHGVDHVFLKGHRLMVTVQSSWFPLYDRNPQTFVPNIMTAPGSAYRAATETIYESAQHPSHIELPVVENR